jgi:hypothetical protein
VGGPRQLWIEPTTGAFDVFARDGRYLGAVPVNGELSYAPFGSAPPPIIRGDTLWLVSVDTTGANSSVVRARVHWPRTPEDRRPRGQQSAGDARARDDRAESRS